MFTLLPYRVRVTLDEGKTNIGTIVESNLRGYNSLANGQISENPEDPDPPDILHQHIVFVREGADEVEIDGVTYLVMHITSILGYID